MAMRPAEFPPPPPPPTEATTGQNGLGGVGSDPNAGGLGNLTSYLNREKIAEMAESVGLNETADMTSAIIQAEYVKLRAFATEGPFSYRVACFFAGVAMFVGGIFGIFFVGGPMSTLINLYQMVFGIIATSIESQKQVLPMSTKASLMEYFRFLFSLKGRGVFYILIGILITAAKPWLNFFIGISVLGCGVASLVYGVRTSKKLESLKVLISDEPQLRIAFAKYDRNGDGQITITEFQSLLNDYGVILTHHELEAAANLLDINGDRTVGLEEFCAWYNSKAIELKDIKRLAASIRPVEP